MRAGKRKYVLILIILLIAAGFLAWLLPKSLGAAFDEEDAVHIDPDKIEEATLIVGTHLIYLGSLTDNLYETAIKSAEESGQMTMYYKSELGEGRWYAINDAGSIEDISRKGREVQTSKIKELFLTHHTKPDGYTYRLKDDQIISVYDIVSPYALEEMQELSALGRQKELNGKGSSVFETEVEDEVTKWCDESLSTLNKEYVRLKTAGADSQWLNMLDKAMGKVDSLRRHTVYTKVEEEVNKLLGEADGEDANYNEALSDALTQLEDSLTETDGNRIIREDAKDSEGITAMAQMESSLISQYIENPGDDILKEMVILQNIMNGITVSKEDEARFLEEKLIPAAEAAYKDNPTESAKNELEYYKNERDARTAGTQDVDQELRKLYDEREQLAQERLTALDKEDLTGAKQIEALIDAKNEQIREKEEAITKETASLTEQKTNLEKQVTEAKKKGESTEKLEQEIQTLDNKIAAISAGMDEGSSSAKIRQMEAEAEEALGEGEGGRERLKEAAEGIAALSETNPKLAGSVLKNLYEKAAAKKYLDDTKIYDSILETIEAALADNLTVLDGTLDEEEAVNVMEETAREDKTAALLGLSMFCEQTAAGGLKNLLKGKVQAYANDGSAYAFAALSNAAGIRYASADAVAEYASFRYIWNDNKKRATLASRKTYYVFTAFHKKVVRKEGEEKDELKQAAGFKGTVYIPEEYIKQEFGCEVYNIPDTGYCLLIDNNITEKAAKVCDALLEKGE